MKTVFTFAAYICITLAVAASVAAAQDEFSFDRASTTTSLEAQLASPTSGHAASDALTPPAGSKGRYKGSLECANCHVAPQAKNILGGVEDFVMLNEYQIWLNEAPHSRAYLSIIPDREHFQLVTQRLRELNKAVNKAAFARPIDAEPMNLPTWGESNERSRRMLQKMFAQEFPSKIENLFRDITALQNAAGKDLDSQDLQAFTPRLAATFQQCLSCHAGWSKTQTEFDTEVLKYGTGVSCESCHGPSSKWLAAHAETDWRKKDPITKETEFGMKNLRNPVVRADHCYACHIGNVREGKVVTHEMYAAGHPPLPSIEIETFADQLPRHWRYLSEKPNFKLAQEFKQHYGYDATSKKFVPWTDVEFPVTKNLLVGGVVAAANSVELLADSAREFHDLGKQQVANASELKSSWPEFAAFDCAACHHDLKAVGRKRGFAGVPGRPPAPYWPRVVSRLSIAYLAARQDCDLTNEFAVNQKSLQDALDRQPFGQPSELAVTGSTYGDWLRGEVANRVSAEPLDRDDAVHVLRLLCGEYPQSPFNPQAETWDFHSARQLAWSINQVYSEIVAPRSKAHPQQTKSFTTQGTEFGQALEALRQSLMLDLPATGQITNQQRQYLGRWRDFDRSEFFQKLAKLREVLKRDRFVNLGKNAAPIELGSQSLGP